LEESPDVPERKAADLRDVALSQLDRERLGAKASAAARVARAGDREPADVVVTDRSFVEVGVGYVGVVGAAGDLVRGAQASFEPGNDAVVSGALLLASRVTGLTEENDLAEGLRDVRPCGVRAHAEHLHRALHFRGERR